MAPTDWGVAVEKSDKVYLHIINPAAVKNKIVLTDFPYELIDANWFETGETMKFEKHKKQGHVTLHPAILKTDAIDQVIVLRVKR
jgi:hypothetical protein